MTDDATPAAAQAGQGAPLSEAEITELKAYHRRSEVNPWCQGAGCKQDWPCATARLLDALDATRADLQQARAEAARQFRGLVWAHYELAEKLDAADTLWLLDLLSGVLAGKTADDAAASARHATSEPAGAAGNEVVLTIDVDTLPALEPTIRPAHWPADHQAEPAGAAAGCWSCDCSGSPATTHGCNQGDSVCRHNEPAGEG
jgi:hypothetical protein